MIDQVDNQLLGFFAGHGQISLGSHFPRIKVTLTEDCYAILLLFQQRFGGKIYPFKTGAQQPQFQLEIVRIQEVTDFLCFFMDHSVLPTPKISRAKRALFKLCHKVRNHRLKIYVSTAFSRYE